MKTKFVERYNNLYSHINFDVTLRDIKGIIHDDNISTIAHIKIKDGAVTFVDNAEHFSKQYNSREFVLVLKDVAEKYPDLDVELFYSLDDAIKNEKLINIPVFSMSNSPLDCVYNPVVFYECRNTITYLNQWSDRQVPFSQKKKRVFGRYGFTGLQGTNITNWIYNHKIQFALASMLYSNTLDIKFLLVPHDINLYKDQIEEQLDTDIRDIILNLPIFDKSITDLWVQTIGDAFNSQSCIFTEGNSICSPARILTTLHNDGTVIQIGRKKFQSFLEMVIQSIDTQLVYSYHETPNESFLKCAELSFDDETYRIEKNKAVKEYFNIDTMVDLTYETLKSYSELIKK